MYLFMITRQFGEITYLRLSLINPREEEQVGQEEADAELQVEGGAGALDGSAQQEGEGRQEEAQQREAQPHVGDHSQNGIRLRTTKGGTHYSFQLCSYVPDGESDGLRGSAPQMSGRTSLPLAVPTFKMRTHMRACTTQGCWKTKTTRVVPLDKNMSATCVIALFW